MNGLDQAGLWVGVSVRDFLMEVGGQPRMCVAPCCGLGPGLGKCRVG